MKTISGTKYLALPDEVEVSCKARMIKVTGPRGELSRSFKHVRRRRRGSRSGSRATRAVGATKERTRGRTGSGRRAAGRRGGGGDGRLGVRPAGRDPGAGRARLGRGAVRTPLVVDRAARGRAAGPAPPTASEGAEPVVRLRAPPRPSARASRSRRAPLSQLQLELSKETAKDGAKQLKIQLWFGTRKQQATIRTISTHIQNMIIGVTQGYCYKMRFVYSHFPINVALNGRTVEVRNFLGDKLVRKIKLLDGVEYVRTADVKDQIELIGNDVTTVSLTAARIRQSCDIKNKDLRKFLDGIFVSQKGPIPKPEA